MEIDLQSVTADDRLLPGRFVFVCTQPSKAQDCREIQDYGYGIIITDDLMPDNMLPTRQLTFPRLEYPVWLIGKRNFLLAHLKDIYYPNTTQVEAARHTELADDFATFHLLATEDRPLEYFVDDIRNDKSGVELREGRVRQFSARDGSEKRLFCSDSEEECSPGGRLEGSDKDAQRASKKRVKTGMLTAVGSGHPTAAPRQCPYSTVSSSTIPTVSSQSLISSHFTKARSPQAPVPTIKPEIIDNGGFPIPAVVKLFVGSNNAVFCIPESSLGQSPVLSTLIIRKPGKGPYVMDPELQDVDPDDFRAVAEFLQEGEFAPRVVRTAAAGAAAASEPSSTGVPAPSSVCCPSSSSASLAATQDGRSPAAATAGTTPRQGSARLEGVNSIDADNHAILRLGRIYVLAHRLQLRSNNNNNKKKSSIASCTTARPVPGSGLADLACTKLIAAFPRGWNPAAMLAMVAHLFASLPGHVDDAAAAAAVTCLPDRDKGRGRDRDPLKEWCIEWLAENLERITSCRDRTVVAAFWDLLDTRVGLKLAVARAWGSRVEMWKGTLCVVDD